MKSILGLLLLWAAAAPAFAEDAERLALVRQLHAEQRWQEIVDLSSEPGETTAEMHYYRGIALARLERWAEAEAALAAGERKAPGDPRFPLERAGVAYKRGERGDAKSHLRRALALDPRNEYARDFLATVYFLEGNLEAALKHWNQIERPALSDLRFAPEPRLRAELRERAVDFSLGAVWSREDYLATQARLDHLGIFPRHRFQLAARPDGSFEAIARVTERNGWGNGWLESLMLLFRGLPYQTVHPEVYNLNRSAINFTSLYRWDAQKRRVAAALETPLGNHPARRARIYFDGRNENWDVSRSLFPLSTAPAGFNLRKFAGGAEYRSVVNGRFRWNTGLEFAHRRFRNPQGQANGTEPFLADGFSVHYVAGSEFALLRFPERRFFVEGSFNGSFGRFFASPSRTIGRLQGGLHLEWFPRAEGDDYRMQARLRAGSAFGQVPLDELFLLGLERDTSLWLRAHLGTSDGRKGNSPLGRQFFLANWEIDKNIYEGAFVGVKVGPFVDVGRVSSDAGFFGSPEWLWDSGGQLKVRLFGGVTVAFVYGHDLRSGRNTFYTLLSR